MLPDNWMNDSLGELDEEAAAENAGEPTFDERIAQELSRAGSITSQTLSRRVNKALVEESSLIEARYSAGQTKALREGNEAMSLRGQNRDELASEVEADQQNSSSLAASNYDMDRSDFGTALNAIRASGKVKLDLKTCDAIVELDHDGVLSEAMEANVNSLYGRNGEYAPRVGTVPLPRTGKGVAEAFAGKPMVIDFSRESVSATASQPVRTVEAEARSTALLDQARARAAADKDAARIAARRAAGLPDQRPGMVTAGQAVAEVVTGLRRPELAESSPEQTTPDTGPELG